MIRILDLRRLDAIVTARRAHVVGGLIAATALIAAIYLIVTATGTLDRLGRPLGTDFSNVYAAGRLAIAGSPALAWDWPRHFAEQQAVHGRADIPFYGWHYPPPFLLVATLLGMFPYGAALALWQSATLALAAVALRPVMTRRGLWLVALGFPAVAICLGHGQNGFLTAALLGGALPLLGRRPLVAGVLIGLLAYKPQLGILLPVALAMGGHWRAFAAAAATVGLMALATLGVWGAAPWEAFAASLGLTTSRVVEDAQTGPEKIVSAFAAVRLHGGPSALAWVAQAAALAIACAAMYRLRTAREDVRNAGIVAGTLLATPYAFDYDMVVLGFAIAWLARDAQRHEWRTGEPSLLALAYLAPLIGRAVAATTGVPLNLIAIAGVMVVAWRRAGATPDVRSSPSRRLRAASAP